MPPWMKLKVLSLRKVSPTTIQNIDILMENRANESPKKILSMGRFFSFEIHASTMIEPKSCIAPSIMILNIRDTKRVSNA